MAMNVARNVNISLQRILNRFRNGAFDILSRSGIGSGFEPALAIPALHGVESQDRSSNQSSLKELFDGFLWAVPKHRRSKERNRMRRRAVEKSIPYTTALLPCEACGNLRQTGYLCGHCLVKVREETKEIQDKMFEELDQVGVLPDKENVVLYEGETLPETETDKHPVEIKKKRPFWFSKDLTGPGSKW